MYRALEKTINDLEFKLSKETNEEKKLDLEIKLKYLKKPFQDRLNNITK